MNRRQWLLPLLALVLLSACGTGTETGSGGTRLLSDTVYQPQYLEMTMRADARFDELRDARVGGDWVWFLGYRQTAEDGARYPLLRLPLDGGAVETAGYAPAGDAVPQGAEGFAAPAALFTCPDGAVWVQEYVNYGYYALPEDFDPETQNKWDFRTSQGTLHLLRRIGPDGTEERRIDLTALADRLDVESVSMDGSPGRRTPLLDLAGDGAGNLYLLMPGKLCVLDGTGAERFVLDWSLDGGSLVTLGDGTVGAFCYPSGRSAGGILRAVDLEAGDWGTRYEPGRHAEAVWPGFGKQLFLYDGGTGLCGWSAEGETLLAAWEDAAVNPDLIQRCAGLPDGRIVLLCLHNGEPEAVVLSETGRDAGAEVETLTFAVLSPDDVDWARVNEFNRTHTDVQINVEDYTTYDENGYFTRQGRDRLLTELAAGKTPDIMSLGGSLFANLPYQQMAEKGYWEDLLPFLDRDPDLSREDLMEAPLNAAMLDGKLYLAFDSVSIETLIGPERIVGDRYSWNSAELKEAFASMPEGSSIAGCGITKEGILACLVDPDSYVDWKTGECSFDSGSFRAALELTDPYPLERSQTDYEEIYEEERRRMRGGLQMLEEVFISSFCAVQFHEGTEYGFGERVAFVGYPTEDGSAGSYFCPSEKLVMFSACKNKEAAWEFIRESFLPKCNLSVKELCGADGSSPARQVVDGGFPINRADFELKKQYEMTLYSEEMLALFEEIGLEYLPPATEEECQRMTGFYNHVEQLRVSNGSLFSIIVEQCHPYFAGERSLDDTVDQIQRRASLYVNENR